MSLVVPKDPDVPGGPWEVLKIPGRTPVSKGS